MKIALIGTGVYGLAIASALAKNNNEITMWSENEKTINEWTETKNLKSIVPSYDMPKNISVTGDMQKAIQNADIIFITTISKYVGSVVNEFKPFYKKNTPICIASKGIEEKSCKLLSNIVREILNTKTIAVISGPTFAVDMLNNEPVALALASSDKRSADMIYKVLRNDTLKLRVTKDMIGVQICGSVKNIIAIASGILGGLGFSESTQAFLINESLHDIESLISFLGGSRRTILSFAGVGDLLMTSMSKKSRNYSFGYVIGSTNSKEEIDKFLSENTVEGYSTLKIITKLLKQKNYKMPLITLLNNIIDGHKDAKELADFLIMKQ